MASHHARALFIAPVWPDVTTTAAGVRTMGLIRALLSRGNHVAVTSPAKAASPEACDALSDLGVGIHPCRANDSPAFARLLGNVRPSVCIFDRYYMEEQYGWQVRDAAPDALRVLDTQDLHFLRISREMLVKRRDSQASQAARTALASQGAQQAAQTIRGHRSNKSNEATHHHHHHHMAHAAARLAALRTDHGEPRMPPIVEEAVSQLPPATGSGRDTALMMRELASIHRSDLTLVCSGFEQDLLTGPRFNVAPEKVGMASFFYPPVAPLAALADLEELAEAAEAREGYGEAENTTTTTNNTAVAMGSAGRRATLESAVLESAALGSGASGGGGLSRSPRRGRAREDRHDFVTIGNFLHRPNLDSVRWLSKEVWPLIHEKAPHLRMHVYGSHTR